MTEAPRSLRMRILHLKPDVEAVLWTRELAASVAADVHLVSWNVAICVTLVTLLQNEKHLPSQYLNTAAAMASASWFPPSANIVRKPSRSFPCWPKKNCDVSQFDGVADCIIQGLPKLFVYARPVVTRSTHHEFRPTTEPQIDHLPRLRVNE